jgi:anhydro-N-acetylmuramic acid kinase
LHKDYGKYIAELVNNFISEYNLKPDLIASHGHTIFHQPSLGLCFQLGDGAVIAAETGINTVCDFRSMDIAVGGQGAPLVPVGDEYLFKDFDFCLNLGGIANFSYNDSNNRLAYDICPCNILLNFLAAKGGFEYDDSGAMASKGVINEKLLQQLDGWNYYSKKPPKSLDKDFALKEFMPYLNTATNDISDLLATVTEHIAQKINKEIIDKNISQKPKVLLTGGGAFNNFLIESLKKEKSIEYIVPDATLINFKEALIFAFLGVLMILEIPNCFASVTGAKTNVCGGAVYIY